MVQRRVGALWRSRRQRDSTGEGKLYLNYPMVEACKDLGSPDDLGYMERAARFSELGGCKSAAGRPSRRQSFGRDLDKDSLDHFIALTAAKACKVAGLPASPSELGVPLSSPGLGDVLSAQNASLADRGEMWVLGTCLLYIPDYSTELVPLRATLGGILEANDGRPR